MILTYFKSKETKGKMPLSPYNDNTFDFITIEVNDILTMYRYMVKNFVLNIPISKSIKTYRRKSCLSSYCLDTYNYVVLDFNDVTTKEKQVHILKYFKKYKCVLGESRSNNGIDNFNMKGILCINSIKLINVKQLVDQIKYDLIEYGTLDTCVTSIGSVSAPINRYNILLESHGEPYEYVYRYVDKPLEEIKPPKSETVEMLCLDVFKSMGFEAVCDFSESPVKFKHDSDNGYYWYPSTPSIMRHQDRSKNVDIYDTVSKIPEFSNVKRQHIDYKNCLENFTRTVKIQHVNERYMCVDTVKSFVCDFLNNKNNVLMIKSPMGTGKSTIISHIISETKEMDLRVLVCTSRISIADDSSLKYGLKVYNKDVYCPNDSFIVQYDSLFKYDPKKFDVVVLDEFMSLILHSRNNISNVFKNILNFFACFKKKLIVADAFLTGYESVFFEGRPTYLIENTYRDDVQVYDYDDFNFFIRSLIIHAKKHKITVSCTSNKIMFALKNCLETLGLKVFALTSETPQIIKDEIYKRFKDNEPFYDVMIFSPTLTVGISNINNVNIHFHYDCSRSCDVISSLQMIKRTRNAKEIHTYVKNITQYLRTTYEGVKNEYIQNLDKSCNYNCFFEYNEYGETRISSLGKRATQIDVLRNILEFNHKEAFNYLLKYQFCNEPVKVHGRLQDNILLPYMKSDQHLSYAEDYARLFGVSAGECECVNSFEYLYKISKIMKPDLCVEDKNKIIKLCEKDCAFLDYVIKYKTINAYQNHQIDKNYIQRIISDSLISDTKGVQFWNCFLNFESAVFNEYTVKEYTSNYKLRMILDGCGYDKVYKNGRYVYSVSDDVIRYSEFVVL